MHFTNYGAVAPGGINAAGELKMDGVRMISGEGGVFDFDISGDGAGGYDVLDLGGGEFDVSAGMTVRLRFAECYVSSGEMRWKLVRYGSAEFGEAPEPVVNFEISGAAAEGLSENYFKANFADGVMTVAYAPPATVCIVR